MATVFLVLMIYHSDVSVKFSKGESISLSYTPFQTIEQCEIAKPLILKNAERILFTRASYKVHAECRALVEQEGE